MYQCDRTFRFDRFLFDKPQLSGFNGKANFAYVLAIIFKLPCNRFQLLQIYRFYIIDILSDSIHFVKFFLEEHSLQFFFAGNDIAAEESAGE